MSTVECAGCGKELTRSSDVAKVDLGSTTVTVCRNQNGSGYRPRESCRAAAWEKLRPCSGCGTSIEPWKWHTSKLCDDCRDLLSRGRAAKPESPVRWLGVDPTALYECGGSITPQVARMLACCLGEVFGRKHLGQRPNGAGYDAPVVPTRHRPFGSQHAGVWVEVREDAVEAARWAFECIYQLSRLQYQLGVERGHNVLRRLAAGEVTTSDYDRDATRRDGDLP